MDSDVESYVLRRSWHCQSRYYLAVAPSQGVPLAAWSPGQWQFPMQWSFWNPLAFPVQLGSHSRRSCSVALEPGQPPAPERDPVSVTKTSAMYHEMVPKDLDGAEGKE